MSFNLGPSSAGVIALLLIFFFIVIKMRRNYYSIIKKYWFFVPSFSSKLRLLTFLASFLVLFVALLDLRGPEERIKATIPDQKTIIIIDASSSMLAEDVRPNRFKRALFLARHFIKQAAGHQISVVLFSDTQKRLVPFTDDIDLLDARVAALEDTDLNGAGSNINQALRESMQYFKTEDDTPLTGNVLLLTDSEEQGGTFDLKDEVNINLAVVGVGTRAGAPIPNRSRSGVFQSYKKFKGNKIISKLNEESIKKLGKGFKNFKYWVATSYTIPTDHVLSFFKNIYKKKLGQTDIRIRPVYGHFLIIFGIFFYFISSFFLQSKTLSKPLLGILLLFFLNSVEAEEEKKDQKQKRTSELDLRTTVLKSGSGTTEVKKFLAQEYLKKGKSKEAITLYEEIVTPREGDVHLLLNLGTAYAAAGDFKLALEAYERARHVRSDEGQLKQTENIARKNILLGIKKQKKKKKQKQKQKEDKEKKEKKEKKDQGKEKDGKGSKGKDKGEKREGKEKEGKKDKEGKDKKKKSKDKVKKGDDKKDPPKEKKTGPRNLDEKEKDIKQKRKLVKIPAMLKQIMDQDRNLQKKYYKTNKKRKRRSLQKRDW